MYVVFPFACLKLYVLLEAENTLENVCFSPLRRLPVVYERGKLAKDRRSSVQRSIKGHLNQLAWAPCDDDEGVYLISLMSILNCKRLFL